MRAHAARQQHLSVCTAPRADTDSGTGHGHAARKYRPEKGFSSAHARANIRARNMYAWYVTQGAHVSRACDIGSLCVCIMSCCNKFNLDHARTGCGC